MFALCYPIINIFEVIVKTTGSFDKEDIKKILELLQQQDNHNTNSPADFDRDRESV